MSRRLCRARALARRQRTAHHRQRHARQYTKRSTGPTTAAIAQNWLDLRAERSLSTFDQRHLLNLQVQYTSGQGLDGGTLMGGWPGRLLKEWTVLTRSTTAPDCRRRRSIQRFCRHRRGSARSGPALTGAPIYAFARRLASECGGLRRAAAGPMGNGGQKLDHRAGPVQSGRLSARTFRPNGRFYLDARVDATNLLNHASSPAGIRP